MKIATGNSTTDRSRATGWRQRGYQDGFHGWRPPTRGAVPEDVPDEYRDQWWVGYRRGREARARV